ncbi:laminin beta-2 chain [Culex quinquefasciatus]|uniref:Laminin beta-2 chain n=1 Tax=Culex quinquefasciatus TaxID=7176 RepID=B0X7B5_CULQU|nr:laminin beta-2 chain [Culex quinquefasciatus]|eukprot:XP_001865537.1 laminin beta-2 chain [Culex quinquefasciatus]
MLPVANVPSRVIDERFPAVKIKARPVLRGVYREPLENCQCGCDPYDGRLLRSPVFSVRDNLLGQSQRAVAQYNQEPSTNSSTFQLATVTFTARPLGSATAKPASASVTPVSEATSATNARVDTLATLRTVNCEIMAEIWDGWRKPPDERQNCVRHFRPGVWRMLRQMGDHPGRTAGGNETNERESEDDQDAATGAYKKEFDSMSKKVEVIQGLLTNTISDREIKAINANIADVKQHLNESAKAVEASEKQLQETSANIKFANIDQKGNIESAQNPTRDAWNRVTQPSGSASERRRTSRMMIKSANHVVTNLTDIIDNNTETPEKIRGLAEQIQQYGCSCSQTLAEQCDEAVSPLESIIRNIKHDLDWVEQHDYAPSRMGLGRDGVGGNRAEKVLEDALDVKNAMDDAKEGKTIDKETDDAYNRANVTAGKVDELKTRLNKLHVSNVQNQQDAEKIIKQAEMVKESANNAHVLRLGISLQLKDTYKTAVATLTGRSNASESAPCLQDQEILHKTYESNQKDLDSSESKIQGLTEQINTHLNKIQSDADRYRQCTTLNVER